VLPGDQPEGDQRTAALTFARAVAANDRKVFGMRVQHLSASL